MEKTFQTAKEISKREEIKQIAKNIQLFNNIFVVFSAKIGKVLRIEIIYSGFIEV